MALVTGASGFIGSNLVRVLLETGVRVRVLLEPGMGTENLNGLDVEHVVGDLRDPEALPPAARGCDTIYHVGAIFDYWLPQRADMFRVNVEGTVHMLRAAKQAGVRRFVHCSSAAVLGTPAGEALADENTLFNNWDTADDYTFSKYAAELEAFRFDGPDLEVVAGLPSFPFGRNDIHPTPTGLLAQRYVFGDNPAVFTGGLNCVNVRDVAEGLHLCAMRGRPGQRYILGGHNLTYRRFAEVLCACAGSKLPRHTINPGRLAWLGRANEWVSAVTGLKPYFAYRAMKYIGDKYLYFDISKARTELGYSIRPLEETMDECARWFLLEHERVLNGQVVHPVELWAGSSDGGEGSEPATPDSVLAE